jgi:roadblock/LC7 domain-containing protein
MRWVKHVERAGEGKKFIQCLMGNLGVDGRIILK